nr:IS30 family transposase [uncultured Lachnoclostridium sp.]
MNQQPEKMQEIDMIVSPLLRKGQSLSPIYASHGGELGCSRRTLYKYIDLRVFTARNGDLPRKVKYKPRKKRSIPKATKRAARLGRTYEDFTRKLQEFPDTRLVEMDTVEGQKGGKVLLTLFFRSCSLMLAYLIEEISQECVKEVFNYLTDILGIEMFQKLFPIILTDNGTEFQDTDGLECDSNGEIRTRIYYCHPNCSWQKGMIEKNHEYVRYVIPKGNSLDCYTQKEIALMMSHINNTARDSLNGCTPYQLSRLLFGSSLLGKLSIMEVAPDDVMLKPALLKH